MWPQLNLRLGNIALLLGRRVLLDQDKIDAVEVRSEHQEKIAGTIAKSGRGRARIGEGQSGKLKEVDLKKTLVIGDEFDAADTPEGVLSSDAEIAGSLYRSSVGVVTEAAEKGGDSVGVAKELNGGGI